YILVMTADHGICPLPEVSRKKGLDARRVQTKPIFRAAEAMLDKRWPTKPGTEAGNFIEAAISNMVYLDRDELQRRGVKAEDAARELAKWLPTQPGIQAAYTAEQLGRKIDPKDKIGRAVQRSFYAGRSGDVSIVQKPYYLLGSALAGTT